MLEDHLDLGHALGAGRANIVLAQRIQHAGLGQAGDVGHRIERQRNNRQEIIRGGGAPYREPLQLHAEDQQQQSGKHKAGHAGKECREKDNNTVRPFVPVQRRNAAQHQPQHNRNGRGFQAEGCRDAETAGQRGGDVTPGLQDVVQVDHILFGHRFIQVVPGFQHRLHFGRGGFFGVKGAAGDRVHGKKGDSADDQQCQNCQQHTFYDISGHVVSLSS